jgi:hypothetical protein
MKTVIKAVAVAATLLVSTAAMATVVVASDNFETGTVGQGVAGTNGGTGWANAWQTAQTAANAPKVVATSTMEGTKALQFTKNDDNAATRTLATAMTGDVFVKFTFQYSGATLGINDFLGFWLGNSDGPNIGLKSNCANSTGTCSNDAFVRTGGNAGSMLDNSDLSPNTTYVLYGHLYKSGASTTYTNFDAWLNPTAAEMLSLTGADATFSGNSNLSSISTVGFRSVNLGGNLAVRVDDISISAVPEPTTIALFGAAMLGMGALRRRRA